MKYTGQNSTTAKIRRTETFNKLPNFDDTPRTKIHSPLPYTIGVQDTCNADGTKTLAYPKGERIFTDGSKTDIGTGSAYFDEKDDKDEYVKTHGRQTVLRSELTAILAVLQNIDIWRPIQLFTDSLTSLQLIRAWIHIPHTLKEEKHLDLLDAIAHELTKRQALTQLIKVKAHIGVDGNERVDKTAKATANNTNTSEPIEVSEVRPTIPRTAWAAINGIKMVNGDSYKSQLRPLIIKWLTDVKKYGTIIQEQWSDAKTDQLDKIGSNSHWRHNGDIPFNQMSNIMRTRNCQLMCNAQLKKG